MLQDTAGQETETGKGEGIEAAEDTWRKIRATYTEVAQQVLGYKEAKKQNPGYPEKFWNSAIKEEKVKDHNEENRKRYKEITKEIRKKEKRCKEKRIEGK